MEGSKEFFCFSFGGVPFGAYLPAPGLGDGISVLIEVVGDAGLNQNLPSKFGLLLLQVGELLLDRGLVVQVDRPVPLPVIAGMEAVDPRQAAGPSGALIDAVEEARRGDNLSVSAVVTVTQVPIERVFVADSLTEMPYSVLGSLGVEQADAILPWAVEVAQACPKPVDAFLCNLS